VKKYEYDGHKTKRHKSRTKLRYCQQDYRQCLTVLCPTPAQAVGQFCILQEAGVRRILDFAESLSGGFLYSELYKADLGFSIEHLKFVDVCFQHEDRRISEFASLINSNH